MEKERDDLQNPITHEGAEPDGHDPNEDADDRADIQQPDGSEVPRPND